MTNTRGRGQRAGLSRAAVLAASWEVVNSSGASALTMRTLARHLDVAPNALYGHVASKTALLDLLLDDLLAAIPTDSARSTDPLAELTALMTATYETLTAHPDLVPLYLARQGARGPHAIRLGALMDDLLARAGVQPTGLAQARRALIIHAIGSAAFATGALVEADDTSPALVQEQSRTTFEHSLRWLLVGATQDATRRDDRT